MQEGDKQYRYYHHGCIHVFDTTALNIYDETKSRSLTTTIANKNIITSTKKCRIYNGDIGNTPPRYLPRDMKCLHTTQLYYQ